MENIADDESAFAAGDEKTNLNVDQLHNLYQQYIIFTEIVRYDLLKVTLSPSGRQLITESKPGLDRSDFLTMIHAMSREELSLFIRRMGAGYDKTRREFKK